MKALTIKQPWASLVVCDWAGWLAREIADHEKESKWPSQS